MKFSLGNVDVEKKKGGRDENRDDFTGSYDGKAVSRGCRGV